MNADLLRFLKLQFSYVISLLTYRRGRMKKQLFLIIVVVGIIVWVNRFLNPNSVLITNDRALSFGDFGTYYNSIVSLVNGGSIYDFGYVYSPLSIIMFIPFGFLSFKNAIILKSVFDIVCYGITTHFIIKILDGYGINIQRTEKLLLFISIILFYPVSVSFISGTVSAQILLLTTMFYYFLYIKRDTTISSILVVIATVIKIIPFDLILLNKEMRKKSIYSIVIAVLLSLLIFGIAVHLDWFRNLANTQSANLIMADTSYDINVSISSMILKCMAFFNSINIPPILIVFKLLITLYMVWFINKKYVFNSSKEEDILYFSLLIILPLVLSSTVWVYYLVFLITPIILWIYVLKFTFIDKVIIWCALVLIEIQPIITNIADSIGGIMKNIVYIIQPSTFSLIFLFMFIFFKILKRKNHVIGCV